MRRFEVLKTPEGYAVRELHGGWSAAPRKPNPVVIYTAQELLEFMFADGADSQFISGRAAE
jgi:hypothetical protein